MAKETKQPDHLLFGRQGEQLAFETLLKQGYIIRERNWRSGHHEIDIVAEKDSRIIIVEVKARKEPIEDISEVIDRKKINFLIAAGNAYLNACHLDFELQFDVILLYGSQDALMVEHIPDACMAPLRTYR